VLAAVLGDIGFESFVETSNGINAYIPEKQYFTENIDHIINDFPLENVSLDYKVSLIEGKDWNEEWEKNFFQPIIVDNQCIIHSSFHNNIPSLPFDIVIDPKMAFGTGHHETTSLMLSFLLQLNLKGKSFLDMGCGTAVLAILAKMKGADPVIAIDNDEWAYNNSIENIRLNNVPDIKVYLGNADLLKHTDNSTNRIYDIIFANINRNILLNDIPVYIQCMKPGSELYLSGFYSEDIIEIQKTCEYLGLKFKDMQEKNNWVAVRFIKLT
jgi:ribosomal protein L11 methyltransferase